MTHRRNGRPIHADRLVPSTSDDVRLAYEVESRFIDLCILYFNLRGVPLAPPASLDGSMLLWRRMRVRHKGGDLRHARAELLATRAVAEWTLEVNADLRGCPTPKVEWRD